MSPIRIAIADDQALFREGIRTLLSLVPDFHLVGEARDGREAIEVARSLRPDVILMDLRMPGCGGVEATQVITREGLPSRVLVLTTFENDEDVSSAISAGALGYLLKDVPSEKLAEAIRLAARGQSALEPSVAAKLVRQFAKLQNQQPRAVSQPLIEPLSSRELQVLRAFERKLAADLRRRRS